MGGKKIFFLFALVFILCNIFLVSATCTPDQTIMKLSASSGALGDFYSSTSYTVPVCYSDIFGRPYVPQFGEDPHACNTENRVLFLGPAVSGAGNAYLGIDERNNLTFDVNNDSINNAADLQEVINCALGASTNPLCDVNNDGATDAVDVQLEINCLLGLGTCGQDPIENVSISGIPLPNRLDPYFNSKFDINWDHYVDGKDLQEIIFCKNGYFCPPVDPLDPTNLTNPQNWALRADINQDGVINNVDQQLMTDYLLGYSTTSHYSEVCYGDLSCRAVTSGSCNADEKLVVSLQKRSGALLSLTGQPINLCCRSVVKIPLVTCQFITSPGYYYLTKNLPSVAGDYTADHSCFTIASSNVILDGRGYSLMGPTSQLIRVINVNNVTIKYLNLIYNHDGTGIYLYNVSNVTLNNLKVIDSRHGIGVQKASYLNIINSQACKSAEYDFDCGSTPVSDHVSGFNNNFSTVAGSQCGGWPVLNTNYGLCPPFQPCGAGLTLCSDNVCRTSCDGGPLACNHNGVCENDATIHEGCQCNDCFGQQDSCADLFVCNPTTQLCGQCPIGTIFNPLTKVCDGSNYPCGAGLTLCSDNVCRTSCNGQPLACNYNGVCENDATIHEGCQCQDCFSQHDSCAQNLICDSNTFVCNSCPDGTSFDSTTNTCKPTPVTGVNAKVLCSQFTNPTDCMNPLNLNDAVKSSIESHSGISNHFCSDPLLTLRNEGFGCQSYTQCSCFWDGTSCTEKTQRITQNTTAAPCSLSLSPASANLCLTTVSNVSGNCDTNGKYLLNWTSNWAGTGAENATAGCVSGQRVLSCQTQTKLGFFDFTNLILSTILITVIYFILINKKEYQNE